MTAKAKPVPNPGSKEAGEAGCFCPVSDNHFGKGWDGGGKIFVMNIECPVHNAQLANGVRTDATAEAEAQAKRGCSYCHGSGWRPVSDEPLAPVMKCDHQPLQQKIEF